METAISLDVTGGRLQSHYFIGIVTVSPGDPCVGGVLFVPGLPPSMLGAIVTLSPGLPIGGGAGASCTLPPNGYVGIFAPGPSACAFIAKTLDPKIRIIDLTYMFASM